LLLLFHFFHRFFENKQWISSFSCKKPSGEIAGRLDLPMVRPAGIEPAHPVPETGALSPELRAH
jgi:hypothetical protein